MEGERSFSLKAGRPVPLAGRAGEASASLGSLGVGRLRGSARTGAPPGGWRLQVSPAHSPAPTCPETQAVAPDSVALGTQILPGRNLPFPHQCRLLTGRAISSR